MVVFVELVQILKPFDHATGVALDHHTGDFGVGIAAGELEAGHHVRHFPYHGIQFGDLPATGRGDAVGLGFD